MTKNEKKRNWTFVAYPESLPEDWINSVQKTGLPFAVSPLHELDKDPTEENKKPHYHVILCFDGPTTYAVVKSITDSIKQPIPQPLQSVKGMYRYFTHKDNADKHQYDEKDIKLYNGFCVSDYEQFTKKEINEIKIKLINLIIENHITEYSELIEHLLKSELYNELDISCTHTLFFDKFITSRRHKELNYSNNIKTVNIQTGEIK